MNETGFKTSPYSDAARRCSEIVTATAIIADAVGDTTYRWVAIRLSDGGSDGTVYASRDDAIRHQLHEELCAYVLCPPSGMQPQEAEIYLAFHRKAYDAGFRMTGPECITPITNEGMRSQLTRLSN
jgi:hypothetical protein